jgi:hypothetical protein
MSVYPNPTEGLIYIDVQLNNQANGIVQIYDMLGKMVRQFKVTDLDDNIFTTDMSTFTNGIYFITLQAGSETISKKVILNR